MIERFRLKLIRDKYKGTDEVGVEEWEHEPPDLLSTAYIYRDEEDEQRIEAMFEHMKHQLIEALKE